MRASKMRAKEMGELIDLMQYRRVWFPPQTEEKTPASVSEFLDEQMPSPDWRE